MLRLNPSEQLADVFVAHRAQLKRAAQAILGDHDHAEDLIQDAYVKALEAVDSSILEPVAYAYRMVRNMAIDRYRRSKLESTLFDEEESGSAVASPGGTPERAAIARQHLTLVAQVLAGLPERTRRVFELYRLEGRTQREIAALFHISPTMVHFLVHEVLALCRASLRGV